MALDINRKEGIIGKKIKLDRNLNFTSIDPGNMQSFLTYFYCLLQECCLCQFVWTANRTNHKAWEELRAQAKVTACPGAGCCSLLHNGTYTFS